MWSLFIMVMAAHALQPQFDPQQYKMMEPKTYKILMASVMYQPWSGDPRSGSEERPDKCFTIDSMKTAWTDPNGDRQIHYEKLVSWTSHGQVTAKMDIAPEKVLLPFKMSISKKNYDSNYFSEMNNAMEQVKTKHNLDHATYDIKGIIMGHVTGRPGGVAASTRMWIYGSYAYIHELFHCMGFSHGWRDRDGNLDTKTDQSKYGDPTSVVGSGKETAGVNVVQMIANGWIPKDRIIWHNASLDKSAKRVFKLSSLDRKYRGPYATMTADQVPHPQALVLTDSASKLWFFSLRSTNKSWGTFVSSGGLYVNVATGSSTVPFYYKYIKSTGSVQPVAEDSNELAGAGWVVKVIDMAPDNSECTVEVCGGKDCGTRQGKHDKSKCQTNDAVDDNCCASQDSGSCVDGYKISWTSLYTRSCLAFECHEPTCSDGVMNNDETDVDCGGKNCAGKVCPTCSDGVKNGDEEDVDCGGSSCKVCKAVKDACAGRDCNKNGACVDGQCVCLPGFVGANCETLDKCAGITCVPSNTNTISRLNDMLSCDRQTGQCDCKNGFNGTRCENALPSCQDLVINQNETGIDCGGPNCSPCTNCTDGLKNGDEVDVDCGGRDCPSCEPKCEADCDKFYYLPGLWSECSQLCGGGVQSRDVTCTIIDEQADKSVPERNCGHMEAPQSQRQCNQKACPNYTWKAFAWATCSLSCAPLTHRTVHCMSSLGGVRVANALCDQRLKPNTTKLCDIASTCTKPDWVPGTWSQCSQKCTNGMKHRNVYCRDATGNDYADTSCTASKPVVQMACAAEDYQCPLSTEWSPCPWSGCTTTCKATGNALNSKGVAHTKSRDVNCVHSVKKSRVDASLCNVNELPLSVMECKSLSNCTGAHWVTSHWSACVNGVSSRDVQCHTSSGAISTAQVCQNVAKPANEQACKEAECLGAGLSPVDEPVASSGWSVTPSAVILVLQLFVFYMR